MPKTVKNVPAIVASVSSADDIRARLAALVSSNADVATALALASLSRSRPSASRKSASSQETESERANRCAQFDDYSARGKIVAFAIGALGKRDTVALAEDAIAKAVGLPVYKVRPALAIVEARLSDLHNAKFPLVSQIGYVASVEGERNEAKTLHFSRVAPAVAKPPRKPRKAVSALVESKSEEGNS